MKHFYIFLLPFCVSCASSFLLTENRTLYSVEKQGDIYVTNFETFKDGLSYLNSEKGGTEIKYVYLIANSSSTATYKVTELGQLQAFGKTKSLDCKTAKNINSLELKPKAKQVVTCTTMIRPVDFPQLKKSDTVAKFQILVGEDKSVKVISFDYLLRTEDAFENSI